MTMYSFRLEHFERWLDELAVKLKTTVKDHVLTVPANLGAGTIRAYSVNDHLSYAIVNLKLDSDLELIREPGEVEGFALCFNQVDTQKELQVGVRQPILTDKRFFRNDIFLTDSRDSAFLRIASGSTVKKLLIFSTRELASLYLPEDILLKLESFARENSINENPYFISLPHRTVLNELFEIKENDPLNNIKMITSIIQLVEKFLYSFLRQEQANLPRTVKKNDLESMQHVEQILSSRLEGFPSLESLAHEVFMSTSKLKTLFKQIYGHTLYDYYNKSRLQRSRELLIAGHCSIKQAGSEIGFSNLSHFAKAFKKEFGILPRDLTRNR
jgi:AraC-like DNA-binding protein